MNLARAGMGAGVLCSISPSNGNPWNALAVDASFLGDSYNRKTYMFQDIWTVQHKDGPAEVHRRDCMGFLLALKGIASQYRSRSHSIFLFFAHAPWSSPDRWRLTDNRCWVS